MIASEATGTGVETWVYFVGAAGAVVVFLAGVALGPSIKAREALFQDWEIDNDTPQPRKNPLAGFGS